MNKKLRVVIAVIVLLFIFSQSLLPKSVSSAESEWLRLHIINPIVRFFGAEGLDKELVRKIAHAFEFTVLSVFIAFLWNGKICFCVLTGLVVAFLDESLQLISGRGAMIIDVWIDLIGVVLGTGIGYLIWRVKEKKAVMKIE